MVWFDHYRRLYVCRRGKRKIKRLYSARHDYLLFPPFLLALIMASGDPLAQLGVGLDVDLYVQRSLLSQLGFGSLGDMWMRKGKRGLPRY